MPGTGVIIAMSKEITLHSCFLFSLLQVNKSIHTYIYIAKVSMKKEKISKGDRELQGSLDLTGLDQDLLMVRRSREEEGEQL